MHRLKSNNHIIHYLPPGDKSTLIIAIRTGSTRLRRLTIALVINLYVALHKLIGLYSVILLGLLTLGIKNYIRGIKWGYKRTTIKNWETCLCYQGSHHISYFLEEKIVKTIWPRCFRGTYREYRCFKFYSSERSIQICRYLRGKFVSDLGHNSCKFILIRLGGLKNTIEITLHHPPNIGFLVFPMPLSIFNTVNTITTSSIGSLFVEISSIKVPCL